MEPKTLEEILDHLRNSGLPPEKINRFISLLRKDGVLDVVAKVLSRCQSLEDALKEISSLGGMADISKEISHKVSIVRNFVLTSLANLSVDKSYMRSFLRKKSKAKKLKEILVSTDEELEETEARLLDAVKGVLLKTLESLGIRDERLKTLIEEIETLQDLEIAKKIWNEIKPELEKAVDGAKTQGQVRRGEEAVLITDDLLNEILEALARMEDNRKELELRGCTFLLLSEVSSLKDQILNWLSSNFGKESYGVTYLLKMIRRLSDDSEALLSTSIRLLNLRSELEAVKREVLDKISQKMPYLTETISMIGLSSPRLPCVISMSEEIASLRYEVSRLGDTVSALKELSSELDHFTGEIKFQPEKLSYRTEPDFLKSLIETLRAFRLSRGLPSTAYSLPGLMEELLSLYPRWREYVKEQLEEKGYLEMEELSFIPEMWREWFLSNLEEEGLITISDGKILPRAPSSELRKLRMKFEFLKDTYEDMKPIFQRAGISEQYLNSLERKLALLMDPSYGGEDREKLQKEVEEGIDRALSILKGGMPDEKDETGGDGPAPGWQVHLDS